MPEPQKINSGTLLAYSVFSSFALLGHTSFKFQKLPKDDCCNIQLEKHLLYCICTDEAKWLTSDHKDITSKISYDHGLVGSSKGTLSLFLTHNHEQVGLSFLVSVVVSLMGTKVTSQDINAVLDKTCLFFSYMDNLLVIHN